MPLARTDEGAGIADVLFFGMGRSLSARGPDIARDAPARIGSLVILTDRRVCTTGRLARHPRR